MRSNNRTHEYRLILFMLISLILALAVQFVAIMPLAAQGDDSDNPPPQQSTTGPTPPPGVAPPTTTMTMSAGVSDGVYKIITGSGVPAYEWHHGCGPTALGMVLGYYDIHGYSDLFLGCADYQTWDVNQGIASEQEIAGSPRHYEDYSLPIDSPPNPILPDRSEPPPGDEHTSDSIADFMRTSWSAASNYYGWSWSNHVGPAFVQYVNFRNSSYGPLWNLYGMGTTLTWSVLTTEIDNNRPMVFLVDSDADGSADHFITVIGYRITTRQQYACWDTWFDTVRWCDFAGTAVNQPFGVWGGWSFTFLNAPPAPTVTTNPATNVSWNFAILHGNLDSVGTSSPALVSFEWATDEYYHQLRMNNCDPYDHETIPPWPMTSTGQLLYSLSGLSPGITYHFRTKAVGVGTTYGDDMTFTTASTPEDGDGVPAGIEDAAPNNGDGNYDGTPDSQQSNVASLPNAVNGEYATIESPAGTSLTNVAAVSVSSLPSEGRPNLMFPYGLFSFNINGVPAGSTMWVRLRFENAVPIGSQYWKYGPTPDDPNPQHPTPHWYQITLGSNDGDNVIQIPLVDGGLGDDDLTANEVIIDQGGPGNPSGGGVLGVPVFPSVYSGIGAALGGGVLAYLLRKRLLRQVR